MSHESKEVAAQNSQVQGSSGENNGKTSSAKIPKDCHGSSKCISTSPAAAYAGELGSSRSQVSFHNSMASDPIATGREPFRLVYATKWLEQLVSEAWAAGKQQHQHNSSQLQPLGKVSEVFPFLSFLWNFVVTWDIPGSCFDRMAVFCFLHLKVTWECPGSCFDPMAVFC